MLPAAGQGPEEIVGAGTQLRGEMWSQRQEGKVNSSKKLFPKILREGGFKNKRKYLKTSLVHLIYLQTSES